MLVVFPPTISAQKESPCSRDPPPKTFSPVFLTLGAGGGDDYEKPDQDCQEK